MVHWSEIVLHCCFYGLNPVLTFNIYFDWANRIKCFIDIGARVFVGLCIGKQVSYFVVARLGIRESGISVFLVCA